MTEPIRMPNGVMDWLDSDPDSPALAAETIAAEAASLQGEPESYERALERQRTRRPAVRRTGRPLMTMIAEALGETPEDNR